MLPHSRYGHPLVPSSCRAYCHLSFILVVGLFPTSQLVELKATNNGAPSYKQWELKATKWAGVSTDEFVQCEIKQCSSPPPSIPFFTPFPLPPNLQVFVARTPPTRPTAKKGSGLSRLLRENPVADNMYSEYAQWVCLGMGKYGSAVVYQFIGRPGSSVLLCNRQAETYKLLW